MKKERFGTLANDISAFTFDLDPFCGQTEEECLIETANLLYDSPADVSAFLCECADNTDLDMLTRAVAETLIQRIADLNRSAGDTWHCGRDVEAYSTGGGFYEAVWRTRYVIFHIDSENPAIISAYLDTEDGLTEDALLFSDHCARAPFPGWIYEVLRAELETVRSH